MEKIQWPTLVELFGLVIVSVGQGCTQVQWAVVQIQSMICTPLWPRVRESLLAPPSYTFQLSKHIYTTRMFASLLMWDCARFLYYSHFNRCTLSINFSFTQIPIWTDVYIISIYSRVEHDSTQTCHLYKVNLTQIHALNGYFIMKLLFFSTIPHMNEIDQES